MLEVEGVVREPDVRVRLTVAEPHQLSAEQALARWASRHHIHWIGDVVWTGDAGDVHVDFGGHPPGEAVQGLVDELRAWCDAAGIDAVLAFPTPSPAVLLACDGNQWDVVVDGVGAWLAPAATPADDVRAAAAAWLEAHYGSGVTVEWESPVHPSAIVGRITPPAAD